MPRANRHYLPGYVWHITHRCHQKEFLLKFSLDRRRYVQWLFKAKKKYGLSILNYIITSNHIHLMVADTGKDIIPKSMQLIAGRTGQEYNQRKSRKGAFWEDRYHATIVQTNRHLFSCMAYIDLNMVRAGVVVHPSEWEECGYNEILHQPGRYRLIDRKTLKSILGFTDEEALIDAYQQVVSNAMQNKPQARQPMWTESIAVGDEDYVAETKRKLSSMAIGRKIIPNNSAYELREPLFPYCTHFDTKNHDLILRNTFLWNINYDISCT
jgi:putative transposase